MEVIKIMNIEISKQDLVQIEKLESKYLKKYYHFLKFSEDEILEGFATKNDIKDNWIDQWNKDIKKDENKTISDFSVGAERIVYSLLHGRGVGQPNSAPIGSDLFFEVPDAFIHIDLKTVQIKNFGDYINNIVVGNNQNSYKTNYDFKFNKKEYDLAALPYYYKVNRNGGNVYKPCLTYFIAILYEADELDILAINLISMPNGALIKHYKDEIINAGKTTYDSEDPRSKNFMKSIRYAWHKALDFKLLDNEKRYMPSYYNSELVEELYSSGKITDSNYKNIKKRIGEHYQ